MKLIKLIPLAAAFTLATAEREPLRLQNHVRPRYYSPPPPYYPPYPISSTTIDGLRPSSTHSHGTGISLSTGVSLSTGGSPSTGPATVTLPTSTVAQNSTTRVPNTIVETSYVYITYTDMPSISTSIALVTTSCSLNNSGVIRCTNTPLPSANSSSARNTNTDGTPTSFPVDGSSTSVPLTTRIPLTTAISSGVPPSYSVDPSAPFSNSTRSSHSTWGTGSAPGLSRPISTATNAVNSTTSSRYYSIPTSSTRTSLFTNSTAVRTLTTTKLSTIILTPSVTATRNLSFTLIDPTATSSDIGTASETPERTTGYYSPPPYVSYSTGIEEPSSTETWSSSGNWPPTTSTEGEVLIPTKEPSTMSKIKPSTTAESLEPSASDVVTSGTESSEWPGTTEGPSRVFPSTTFLPPTPSLSTTKISTVTGTDGIPISFPVSSPSSSSINSFTSVSSSGYNNGPPTASNTDATATSFDTPSESPTSPPDVDTTIPWTSFSQTTFETSRRPTSRGKNEPSSSKGYKYHPVPTEDVSVEKAKRSLMGMWFM